MSPQETFLSGALQDVIIRLARDIKARSWDDINKELSDEGFGARAVLGHRQDIMKLYLNTQAIYAKSLLNEPTRPASPPHESETNGLLTPTISTSTDQGRPISLHLKTTDYGVLEKPEYIQIDIDGCEWARLSCEHCNNEENEITYDALEQRDLHTRMSGKTILLTWRFDSIVKKTRTTLFKVVSDVSIERNDIRFGRDWLNSTMPKKLQDASHDKGHKRTIGQSTDIEMSVAKRQNAGMSSDDIAVAAEFCYEYVQIARQRNQQLVANFDPVTGRERAT